MPWAPITYREFYDVPRCIVVRHDGRTYLMESVFSDELDDYQPEYTVFLMPTLSERDLDGSWVRLSERATATLGRIAVRAVRFDASRRKQIDIGCVAGLAG